MKSNILKIILSIILVIIIALSSFIVLSLNQINELQNQNSTLKTQAGELQNQTNTLQTQNDKLQYQNIELQNQTNTLQNQVSELKEQNSYLTNHSIYARITGFRLNGIDNPVGVMWNTKFIVEVLNNETSDVNGLTITFNIIDSAFDVHREIEMYQPYVRGYVQMGETLVLGLLNQKETIEMNGVIMNNLDDDAKLRGSTFVVTLKLGDIVLDEARINM